ncbi:MAG TPA: hypothetical protein VFD30_06710, partial [Terriglobia bacterium]|nr:hypothetical protein [Terriglobia bacterium]
MPPRKSIRSVGLLDTIIILVLAFTADLLLLWIASQIRGLNLFEHLPPWLTALSKSVWSYVTGGASAVVLAFLRRRIKSTTASPNYLLWSGGAAIAILMMVAVTTKLLAPPVVVDLGFRASEFDLKFRVHPATNAGGTSQAQGSRLRPLLAFQQRNPKVRERENIALQPDGLYKAVCDLPARCGQFMARAYGVETESEMRVDPTSPPLEISFVRSAKDPVAARTTPEVLAECDEGQNCSISKLDLGWASDGQSCSSTSREWLPRLVAVAYALEPTTDQVQPGWRVPSLQTLNSMKDREKVGYTKFLIQSGPLPNLSAADAFTYLIKVNGTPIYVDGARPEDMIEPFNPSEGISFAFGLENLNFSGADQGCENISV